MIVLRNLQIADDKMRFEFYNAIYKKKKCWFAFNCHGFPDGKMTIRFPDAEVWTTPSEIRGLIKTAYNIDIQHNEPIFIAPCYSKYVFDKYEYELKHNKVFILFKDVDEEVTAMYISRYSKMGCFEGERLKGKDITIFLTAISEMSMVKSKAYKKIYDSVWRKKK
jgi:hypothetical protein